jgi:hypothetical protein
MKGNKKVRPLLPRRALTNVQAALLLRYIDTTKCISLDKRREKRQAALSFDIPPVYAADIPVSRASRRRRNWDKEYQKRRDDHFGRYGY